MNQKRMFLKKLIWMQMLGLTGGSLLPWTTFTGNPIEFNAPKAHTLKSVTVDIEPIQDLHGYDNPWPAGGGKNLVDIDSPIYEGTNISVSNGVITSDQPDGQGATRYIEYTASNLTVGTTYYLSVNILTNTTGDRIVMSLASGGTGSAQTGFGGKGYIGFSFEATDTSVTLRIKQNSNKKWSADQLQLEVGSSRTAYSPYSNICPISGWTQAKLWWSGENLCNVTYQSQVPSINTGSMVSVYGWSCDYIKVDNSIGYYCFANATASNSYILYYDAYKNYLGYRTSLGDITAYAKWPQTGFIKIRVDNGSNADPQIQLNLGSTAAPYSPYNGTSVTIPFGQTVYGGTLDVVSGVLTATMAIEDMGLKTYLYRNGCFDTTISDGKLKSYSSGEAKAVCSAYKQASKVYTQLTDGEMCFGSGYINGSTCSAIFKNTQYTDAATFKSAMSGVQLVYELATPITIQLTPQEVDALQGRNVMWTDCSNLTVEAKGTAVELSALQSLNLLLGNRYVNNHTAEDVSDDEALDIILGGNER